MRTYILTRLWLILLVFLSCTSIVFGQEGQELVDQLTKKLLKAKEDTTKADLLYDLSSAYRYINNDSSVNIAKRSLELSIRTHWKLGQSRAYGLLTQGYIEKYDFATATDYANKALALSIELDDKVGISACYGDLGKVCTYQTNYTKALEYFGQALKYAEQVKATENITTTMAQMAGCYENMGYYEKALDEYLKAMKLSESINNQHLSAAFLASIGALHLRQERYAIAIAYLLKASEKHRMLGETISQLHCYLNMAAAYIKNNNPDSCYYYVTKGMGLDNPICNMVGNSILADYYLAKKDYKNALDRLDKTEKLCEQMQSAVSQGQVINTKADVYLAILQNKPSEVTALTGLDKTAALTKALAFANRAIEIITAEKDIENLKDCYRTLANLHEFAGNEKAALAALKEYHTLKDSVRNDRTTKSLADMREKYEAEKKDQEISLLSKDKSLQALLLSQQQALLQQQTLLARQRANELLLARQTQLIQHLRLTNQEDSLKQLGSAKALEKLQYDKNTSLLRKDLALKESVYSTERSRRNSIALVILSLFVVSGLSYYSINQRRKLSFQQRVAETEMKALRAQMNPHFIFNSLNSIYSFLQGMQVDQAKEYLLKFSKLTRMILENSMHSFIPLKEELSALELYLDIERFRLSHKMQYEIIVAKGIDEETTMIPPMILQPFIENAIWHGISHADRQGLITIRIGRQNGLLHCTVEDNGIGRLGASELKKGGLAKKAASLGLKLTEERIQIINKMKKAKGSVAVIDLVDAQNKPNGLKVELTLPYEQVS